MLKSIVTLLCAAGVVVGQTIHPPSVSSTTQRTIPKTVDVLTTLSNAIIATNASNHFALNLLRTSSTNGNSVIAPFSISTILSILYQGAGEGTVEEISNVMGYGNHTEGNRAFLLDGFKSIRSLILAEKGSENELIEVNTLLVDSGINLVPGLEPMLRNYYGALLEKVNFRNPNALKILDALVELKTKGHIKHAFGNTEISPNTLMVLANIIYFKGVWQEQFDPKQTVQAKFLNEGSKSKSKNAPFMTITDRFLYTYYPRLNLTALDLPYKGQHFRFTILLPDGPTDLPGLVNSLEISDVQEMILDMNPTEVKLQLPRFNISTEIDLRIDLEKLGLHNAFSKDSANFTYFTDDERLFVNQFVHQTLIEVNEQGTVAAAVTALSQGKRSGLKPVEVNVSHPFIFMIREAGTGLIIFLGKVTNI